MDSASALIDQRIQDLGDWRGQMLAKVRDIIRSADPEVTEEWKWRGVPVWSHAGILCTGETYKAVVKLTFAKGAALQDPAGLFNSSLGGNLRRAIDIREGETLPEKALRDLIHAAIAHNVESKSKPRPAVRESRSMDEQTPKTPPKRTTGLSPKEQKLMALREKALKGANAKPGAAAASSASVMKKNSFAGKKTAFQRKAT